PPGIGIGKMLVHFRPCILDSSTKFCSPAHLAVENLCKFLCCCIIDLPACDYGSFYSFLDPLDTDIGGQLDFIVGIRSKQMNTSGETTIDKYQFRGIRQQIYL